MTRIALLGATGFIGSRILAEALDRHHAVISLVRDPGRLAPRPGLAIVAGDVSEVDGLAATIGRCEVVVVAVTWNTIAISDVVDLMRRSGVPRAIFVVGAGSLLAADGRLWFEHMAERGITPPTSRAALEALKHLQTVDDIDWVAASPSATIEAGNRTGQFERGSDRLVVDAHGVSRISAEDFAVAIIDEVETPTLSRARFTVGYC